MKKRRKTVFMLDVPSEPHFDRVYPIRCKDGDVVVGAVDVVIIYNRRKNKSYALIDDLEVLESHQGQGLGRKLMNAALDVAKKEKCYKVIANSHRRRKKARALYKSMGFSSYSTEFRLDLKKRD